MEKDSKLTVIVIVILVLICFGILGYIVYFKTNQKPIPEKINNVPEPSNEAVLENEEEVPKEETKEEKLDEVAKKLYKIIGNNPEFRYEKITTYEDLSENVRDSIVINYIESECKETTTYEKEYFLLKYKEIFNDEKGSDDGLCKLVGGKYECTRYCSEFGPAIFSKYLRYEKEDDDIVIYELVGHFEYLDDGKIYLKADASDDTSLASFNDLEEADNLDKKYKLPTYKHTFEKNDDNYYWTLSELVEQ